LFITTKERGEFKILKTSGIDLNEDDGNRGITGGVAGVEIHCRRRIKWCVIVEMGIL